jgi:hypothetical protein
MRSTLRPGWDRKLSIIYYLRRADGAVKIGWSTCLPQRIKQLERVHGPLELLIWEPGGYDLEQQRHDEFDDERLDSRYEWFRLSPELAAWIQQIQAELDEADALFGPQIAANLGVSYDPSGATA